MGNNKVKHNKTKYAYMYYHYPPFYRWINKSLRNLSKFPVSTDVVLNSSLPKYQDPAFKDISVTEDLFKNHYHWSFIELDL